MNNIQIIKPDDWHVHFREGELMKLLVPETSKLYNRAIVMPNLINPISNQKLAIKYKDEILKFSKNNLDFEPLITFYLTEDLPAKELVKAFNENTIFGAKLYPAGATTNSSRGVKNISKIFNLLEIMSNYKIPLLIHGEVNDEKVDVFDREKVFIDNVLIQIIDKFPNLKITLEHITTKHAVDFINNASNNVKASITPHHLILNRTDMLAHRIKPHYYCLPILKREDDRNALLKAAFNENNKFFMGTDSAPHELHSKESACGCAGVFNTINSIQIVTQLFENYNKIHLLENFLSINGSLHYKLPINSQKINLVKQETPIDFPEFLNGKNFKIKIFKPNFKVYWQIIGEAN
tara:strand:- start:86 stop:1135 length:1050 start_codon:yes stop_codon:yes gene_type:complete